MIRPGKQNGAATRNTIGDCSPNLSGSGKVYLPFRTRADTVLPDLVALHIFMPSEASFSPSASA
jgi:hypothetical protein